MLFKQEIVYFTHSKIEEIRQFLLNNIELRISYNTHYINYVKLPKNIITDFWKLIDNNNFHKVTLIFDIILKDEKYVIIKIQLEN